MCLLACPGCCSSPTLVAEDPRHETTSAARRRSPHSHGPPVASRAPRPRRRCLTAPRTACRPPAARSRCHGPATTSAARAEVGSIAVRPSPRELRGQAGSTRRLENGLQAADGRLPWPRTRDDVRGTTQKSVVPRSARRLASCEATPAVFGGSQNGWRPTDGPLSWPPKRPLRDLRVVPTCASSTAYACDVASPKLVQDGRLG